MTAITLNNPGLERPIRVNRVIWFGAVHLLALFGVGYLALNWYVETVVMAISLYFACHLSITMGMHRLYSHRAYKAAKPLEIVLLLLSAATFQNSVLWWAERHRLHHAFSDTEHDPYTVKHGFWWAHFAWLLHARNDINKRLVKDLLANKPLMLQHRFYYPLAFLIGLGVPTVLAYMWGDAFGGLLVGGFLRLAVQYHTTWCINSVAHAVGPWRYSKSITARTCYCCLAWTVGEWNHEGHHHAEEDYRLGNRRWYDFDPGKWLIWLFWFFSRGTLVWGLCKTSDDEFDRRVQHAMP